MSKFLVETFYTCSFKITHKLNELNEKKLSELENRNDGKVEIIEVKLNSRKTKTINEKNQNISLNKSSTKNIPEFSSIVNDTIANSNKLQSAKNIDEVSINNQRLYKKINDRSLGICCKKFLFMYFSLYRRLREYWISLNNTFNFFLP